MNVEEIKAAVGRGLRVFWSNASYEVIHDTKNGCDQWLIRHSEGSCVGLTHRDGVTLNGRPEQFYTVVVHELGSLGVRASWEVGGHTGTIVFSGDERGRTQIDWDDELPDNWEDIEEQVTKTACAAYLAQKSQAQT